jgi:steroid delta-isomerase-like uncharacterized protein
MVKLSKPEKRARRGQFVTLEENEDIALRWVDVWNRGDLDALDELYAPEFVYHMRFPNLPAGIAGERQVIAMLHGAFPDLEIITEDVIVNERTAVVRWTMPGTHLGNFRDVKPSGKRLVQTGIDILRIVDGKITDRWDEVNVVRPGTLVLG